ncbi:PIN-like domain-containing protein [Actinoplanes sp. NPDC023714]|uniref:PIN-like domain-containing protein n=1 Tax=Actinoplanes sp. NPDC023714 TaxID=3154322 RepID=UPI00340FC0AF
MAEVDDDAIEIAGGASPRSLFPGYYQLSEEQRRAAFQRGLVTLDANALLDLYRFTPRGRGDLLGLLSDMRDRLFVTHQAAREFYRNRLDVVRERISGTADDIADIGSLLTQAGGKVRSFSRRYQVDDAKRAALCAEIEDLAERARASLGDESGYDIDLADVRAGVDVVVKAFDGLFDGRVGPALPKPDHQAALAEAERRIAAKIPPGYADAKKGDEDERRAGDYLLWRQLIVEAGKHDRPVLLISNDEKDDWVAKSHGEIVGPRPELVLEFAKETGSYFYKVTVAGFLAMAPDYLGHRISGGTVAEAQEFDSLWKVRVVWSDQARSAFARLSGAERRTFEDALAVVVSACESSGDPPLLPVETMATGQLQSILEFSGDGEARLRFKDVFDAGNAVRPRIEIHVVRLQPPRAAAPG